VQVARAEAQRRAELLQDAKTALEQTHLAMEALDRGDRKAAIEALQQVTGKLDLVVSRDPKLALAPVDVDTTIMDLYATVDGVKAAVKQARQDISDNHIQEARHRMEVLASEADIHVSELPLATYPAAIKAVAPLIDAGKIDEAKAALAAAVNTIVTETYAIPLPRVRAVAMLDMADKLAAKKDRNEDDNRNIRELVEAARHEIQLAEALGYGAHDDYKPLYAELDDVQRKAGGNTGAGIFRKLSDRVKNFKFLG
jgi:ribosomal protein S20